MTADDKRRGIGDGTRVAYTERRPGFDAKNRFSMPFELPMVRGKMWAEYAKYVQAAPERSGDAAVLHEQIKGMVLRVANKALLPKIEAGIRAAGDDPELLRVIITKLDNLIGKDK